METTIYCPQCHTALLDTPIHEARVHGHTWYCSQECADLASWNERAAEARFVLLVLFGLILLPAITYYLTGWAL